ncbi:molybdenum cofactor biosynthesis protein MoaA [Skermanella stibiiresistens SB22]|uniref:Molybdopterin molybdenumtransferase n=1 Tax=Skermanella stibiiresistens SB22 TaxID=1385369 RepID=W9GZB6_9PROT|nr:gephyrin-like molybdotransferase Glp [Skermanella stibiiresistens]EWY36828.1 molybdenum cofactor biosynthesis protein MoaA [Skermanella stibiiresistens SB22]
MIPVAEARERILSAFSPLPAEVVGLADGLGRVTAEDIVSRLTQPPAAMSAMDGYAVRAADVGTVPATLRRIGEVPAGQSFKGRVGAGETVRIFTGAPLPDGADAVVIQEDTESEGDAVTVLHPVPPDRHVRRAGIDFKAGDVGIPAGRPLTARDIGLAAAMNWPWLRVRRRPRVAILATGDEIILPGEPLGPDQIVSSNAFAIAGLVAACGGVPINLGVAGDTAESLLHFIKGGERADILVTSGGASAGEYDLVRDVLGDRGMELDFYKIAMRPGKPLMFGRLGDVPVLGLPGNPVSSQVCAILFLIPALRRLMGMAIGSEPRRKALLGRSVKRNDQREDYLRATLSVDATGNLIAKPFESQDSSLLTVLARADCLVVRPPFAPPAEAGDSVEILPLGGGVLSF